jgi:hypothetical protein
MRAAATKEQGRLRLRHLMYVTTVFGIEAKSAPNQIGATLANNHSITSTNPILFFSHLL